MYIYTCLPTYINICINRYINICIHKDLDLSDYIHTCTHSYSIYNYPYIHGYIIEILIEINYFNTDNCHI